MTKQEAYHIPVMPGECIDALAIREDGTYVDVTYGGGGHSRMILSKLGKTGKLYAFDQDYEAAGNLPDDERLVFVNHNFKYIKQFLTYLSAVPVDGILADLGVSSHQIDSSHRGFAHRFDGNLDMRMDPRADFSAKDVINTYSNTQLATMFRLYGEVHNSGKLAGTIVQKRESSNIESIDDFKHAIESCIPKNEPSKYLSKVFQAIRLEVNKELAALEILLHGGYDMLKPGGRFVIMSYHSLEDRMVKNFFNSGNTLGTLDKDMYGEHETIFKIINKRPLTASDKEIETNKRARSARLRIAEKIE